MGFEQYFNDQKNRRYSDVEELAWKKYEKQEALMHERYQNPVNVRFREILGMMAVELRGHSVPTEPHVLKVGEGERPTGRYWGSKEWNYSDEFIDGWGWSVGQGELGYGLFVHENGQDAAKAQSAVITRVDNPTIRTSDITQHRTKLYNRDGQLYIMDWHTDTFPGALETYEYNRGMNNSAGDVYYGMKKGEIVRHSHTYDFEYNSESYEAVLAKMLADTLRKRR